jgi:hypothetical protein
MSFSESALTQAEEIKRLRAELAACRMEVATLQEIRSADADPLGVARNQIVTLISAVEDLRAGRTIDQEAIQILESSRKSSKWL